MACHDPFCDDERIEVRWLRPGGVVAESYSLMLCSPKEAVDALEVLFAVLGSYQTSQQGNDDGKEDYSNPMSSSGY